MNSPDARPPDTRPIVTAYVANALDKPLRVVTTQDGRVLINSGMLSIMLSVNDARRLGADIAAAIQGLEGNPPAGPANEFTPAAVEDLMDAETVTTTDGEAG